MGNQQTPANELAYETFVLLTSPQVSVDLKMHCIQIDSIIPIITKLIP